MRALQFPPPPLSSNHAIKAQASKKKPRKKRLFSPKEAGTENTEKERTNKTKKVQKIQLNYFY